MSCRAWPAPPSWRSSRTTSGGSATTRLRMSSRLVTGTTSATCPLAPQGEREAVREQGVVVDDGEAGHRAPSTSDGSPLARDEAHSGGGPRRGGAGAAFASLARPVGDELVELDRLGGDRVLQLVPGVLAQSVAVVGQGPGGRAERQQHVAGLVVERTGVVVVPLQLVGGAHHGLLGLVGAGVLGLGGVHEVAGGSGEDHDGDRGEQRGRGHPPGGHVGDRDGPEHPQQGQAPQHFGRERREPVAVTGPVVGVDRDRQPGRGDEQLELDVRGGGQSDLERHLPAHLGEDPEPDHRQRGEPGGDRGGAEQLWGPVAGPGAERGEDQPERGEGGPGRDERVERRCRAHTVQQVAGARGQGGEQAQDDQGGTGVRAAGALVEPPHGHVQQPSSEEDGAAGHPQRAAEVLQRDLPRWSPARRQRQPEADARHRGNRDGHRARRQRTRSLTH